MKQDTHVQNGCHLRAGGHELLARGARSRLAGLELVRDVLVRLIRRVAQELDVDPATFGICVRDRGPPAAVAPAGHASADVIALVAGAYTPNPGDSIILVGGGPGRAEVSIRLPGCEKF